MIVSCNALTSEQLLIDITDTHSRTWSAPLKMTDCFISGYAYGQKDRSTHSHTHNVHGMNWCRLVVTGVQVFV